METGTGYSEFVGVTIEVAVVESFVGGVFLGRVLL